MSLEDILISEHRPDLPVRGGKLQAVGDAGEFRIPIAKPKPLGPETSWRYFSPARVDVQLGPEEFRRKLHDIDARLEVVWHPVNERWMIWFRDVKGWRLLFPVQYAGSERYMPLDERTIAKVWDRCGRRWGSGRAYWDRIEGEIMRDLQRREDTRRQEARDAADEQWEYRKIKNIGAGSKFTNHHA